LTNSLLIPTTDIHDVEVAELSRCASEYLLSHSWCRGIVSSHLGWAVAGVVGVFLFEIDPANSGIDKKLWVVVGDLPSAYLVYEGNPKWRDALGGYVTEMRKWVAAVRDGTPLLDIIPVAAAPTIEHSQMLGSRLDFLATEILAEGMAELVGDT
jgi:hypothetical protein